MSRRILDIMNSIFESLKSNVAMDELRLIADVERHILAEGDEVPVCNFVRSAKLYSFSRNKEWLCIFEYNNQQYLLLEEKHYNSLINVGFELESDSAITQGAAMLAIADKHLCVRENISSLDIINRCLGITPDTGSDISFLFYDILELFVPFCVFKIDNSRFQLIYDEDISRLICYLLIDETTFPFSDGSHERIKGLMLLESSRSIAASVLNGLTSSLIEYTFLQIYQCIEYLFKLSLSFRLVEDHAIPLEKSLDIVLSHEFKITESENLYLVLKKNISPTIMDTLVEFLPSVISEDSDKYRQMSKYIYKLRCNIAHLRYKQEDLDDVNWNKCIDVLLEIVFAIYQRRDLEIIQACNNNGTWKPLFVGGNV